MKTIKAYTTDLTKNLTFNYRVRDDEIDDLVEELKRENLTIEIE